MSTYTVSFVPSGRSTLAPAGASILEAARLAGEPLGAECGGRGACGRCLVQIEDGEVPEYRVLRGAGRPQVLACLTPVRGPLRVQPLVEAELPRLVSRERHAGVAPLEAWAPWTLPLEPIVERRGPEDLGVAVDVGTTTLRLLLVRLLDGIILGEASAYNPQIARGADVISRIVAAERGMLRELATLVRVAVRDLVVEASRDAALELGRIRAYVVAGNLTMIHLLLGVDPAGIRRVPSEPAFLAVAPSPAVELGWPGDDALVHTVPAAGAWVGGDIVAGVVRAGFPRAAHGSGAARSGIRAELPRPTHLSLYVDLGTNGEIALGGADFALACACSAGPAFEGGGIRCGMRADRGAVDGARIDDEQRLHLSVVGGGRPAGLCGSGLIALADALLRAGWIDRHGRFTARLPERYRRPGPGEPSRREGERALAAPGEPSRREGERALAAPEAALALDDDGRVALYERDLAGLVRAKGAIFAGIRSLVASLGEAVSVDSVIVSGNFGRFLNLPAATGIGLLPGLPPARYSYVGNGSLEGAALVLLSRPCGEALAEYLRRITYVNLSEVPGYMEEFVAACFLPHTDPTLLRL